MYCSLHMYRHVCHAIHWTSLHGYRDCACQMPGKKKIHEVPARHNKRRPREKQKLPHSVGSNPNVQWKRGKVSSFLSLIKSEYVVFRNLLRIYIIIFQIYCEFI